MMQDIGIVDTKKIIGIIKDNYGHDFSNYALTTFKRRLIRIIQLHNLQNVVNLISRLEEDKYFFEKFLDDLLIEQTELFRDPSLWRLIRDIYLPELRRSRDIKIWFPYTTSGDEVHSMAVLLKEAGILEESKMVVSGLSERILNRVKLGGMYDLKKLESSDANYKRFNERNQLSDYYTMSNSRAVMDPELLKNTEFKVHDPSREDALPGFRLIICRNQLIYFNQNLHDQVTKSISEGLIASGYLILGAKENLEGCSVAPKYILINREEKIYKKKA